tara:strand:+ start:113 stop:397 length:285 start_codon:yes stop_codon:yes gene_type:complete
MMSMDDVNSRFDRLETKIDKLSDAMITLIQHDTKIDGLVAHNHTQDSRLNKHSVTLDEHSIKLATVSKSSGANEWFVRLLIAALVTGAAFMMRG